MNFLLQKKASLSENRTREEDDDDEDESDHENGNDLPEFSEGDFVTLDEVNILDIHLNVIFPISSTFYEQFLR
jgi:hypothetical protein